MKKIILVVVLVLSLALCACSTVTGKPDTTVDSADEAISVAKSDKGALGTDGLIASKLGLMFYSEPNYGACYAKENADGSWTVTLNGNMSGFTDAAKTDFDFAGFKCIATVTADKSVYIDSVERLD